MLSTEASRSKKRCLDESLSQDSEGERELSVSLSGHNPQSSRILPIETIKEIQESLDPSELLKYQLLQAEGEIARLNEQTRLLKANLQKIELQNEDLKSRRFHLENMTKDYSISFETLKQGNFPGNPKIPKSKSTQRNHSLLAFV